MRVAFRFQRMIYLEHLDAVNEDKSTSIYKTNNSVKTMFQLTRKSLNEL